jgi:cell division protein FtsI/penicillin-binding protein 2
MQATPLQMANVAATVVNGGTLYAPHIVKAIRNERGQIIKRFDHDVIRQVPVTAESLREVRAGMDEVTKPWGTAYGEDVPGLNYGGKTGTAETDGGAGPNTTWFVAYAPSEHPVIALAVFMERSGGYGANTAAPVARRILAGYFHKTLPQ